MLLKMLCSLVHVHMQESIVVVYFRNLPFSLRPVNCMQDQQRIESLVRAFKGKLQFLTYEVIALRIFFTTKNNHILSSCSKLLGSFSQIQMNEFVPLDNIVGSAPFSFREMVICMTFLLYQITHPRVCVYVYACICICKISSQIVIALVLPTSAWISISSYLSFVVCWLYLYKCLQPYIKQQFIVDLKQSIKSHPFFNCIFCISLFLKYVFEICS